MKKNLIKIVCLIALTVMLTLSLTPLLQASAQAGGTCCSGAGTCIIGDYHEPGWLRKDGRRCSDDFAK